MRMANYGIAIYSDNTYAAIRTNINPGVSDKYNRSSGVVLLVVVPYQWVVTYRESLDYITVGKKAEQELIYQAAMAWLTEEEMHSVRA